MEVKRTKQDHWDKLSCNKTTNTATNSNKSRESKRVYLGDQYPDVYLTTRQAECVYYLMLYRRRKYIAEQLGISIRTVDCYLNEVKAKINSHNLRELLSTIRKTDFTPNYYAAFLNQK